MRQCKLLLVEDNENDARLINEAFAEAGITCETNILKDGEEAVEYLYKRGKYKDAFTPCLIILDLKLPKKSGLEVLKDIKSSESLKEIPVVMLTNSDARSDILDSYEHQVNAYITKPLIMKELVDVVNYIYDTWINK